MSAMHVEAVGACVDCGCGLIAQSVWSKAETPQRRDWLAADLRMLQGRGLCRACYLDAHRKGAFPKRGLQAVAEPKPCARCGITSTTALCGDCVEVLDRDELVLWTAP